jgi:hypothetical protein
MKWKHSPHTLSFCTLLHISLALRNGQNTIDDEVQHLFEEIDDNAHSNSNAVNRSRVASHHEGSMQAVQDVAGNIATESFAEQRHGNADVLDTVAETHGAARRDRYRRAALGGLAKLFGGNANTVAIGVGGVIFVVVFVVFFSILCKARPASAPELTRQSSPRPGTMESPNAGGRKRTLSGATWRSQKSTGSASVRSKSRDRREPESDGEEQIPESAEDLERILNEHGINTASWGKKKSSRDLFDEVISGKCILKSFSKGRHYANPRIERHVRLCIAKIRAVTSNGTRYLKYRSAYDGSAGQQMGEQTFSDRDCTKKILFGSAEEAELDRMLLHELKLSDVWQRDNLILESMTTQGLQEVPGHGDSLPGLLTRFSFSVATVLVKDAFAPAVAGTMGLPHGEDFSMLEGNKTRFWTWVESPADGAQPARPG